MDIERELKRVPDLKIENHLVKVKGGNNKFSTDADATTRYQAQCYEVRWDGPIVHQPEEVASGGWMTVDELREHLADPGWPFVPDGRVGIERWFTREALVHPRGVGFTRKASGIDSERPHEVR